jgi:hypothetical protein
MLMRCLPAELTGMVVLSKHLCIDTTNLTSTAQVGRAAAAAHA